MGRTVGVLMAAAGLVAALLASWLTRWMLVGVPNEALRASQQMQTLPQLPNISAQAPEPLAQEAKPLLSLPGPTGSSTICPDAKTFLSYLRHVHFTAINCQPIRELLSYFQRVPDASMAHQLLM
ncbi:unnamed protein product, partial [Closterium sp. NIES-53]